MSNRSGEQVSYHRIFMLILLVNMLLIAACGTTSTDESLPTVAVLPTETERPRNEIGLQATLPPEWTLTPTETTTLSPTVTETVTITPSMTITDTPTKTYTPEPTVTQEPRPVTNLLDLALQTTILPQDFTIPQRDGINVTLPPSTAEVENLGNGGNSVVVVTPQVQTAQIAINCTYYPAGGFGAAFASDATIAQGLGCPIGNPPNTVSLQAAFQVFERGFMIWLGGSPNNIYAFFSDSTYQVFADSFDSNVDPASGGENPPVGLREPTRGFGKVWRSNTSVKSGLGWGVSEEYAATATIQSFERGIMVYIPARGDILVFISNATSNGGTWKSVSGQF